MAERDTDDDDGLALRVPLAIAPSEPEPVVPTLGGREKGVVKAAVAAVTVAVGVAADAVAAA